MYLYQLQDGHTDEPRKVKIMETDKTDKTEKRKKAEMKNPRAPAIHDWYREMPQCTR